MVDHQQQVASLHLRLDNLLLERRRLQEEAQEASAAAQAEVAQLRQRLSAAQAEVAVARDSSCGLDRCSVSSGRHSACTQAVAAAVASALSAPGSTARSSQMAEQPADDEISWGCSLTARAPAARPVNVPPVDLSRLHAALHRSK